jgi:TolB protein
LYKSRLIGLLLLVSGLACLAQREPVLKQIDLPHPYYFREMYLPQLTTGPSGAAWSPDSRSPGVLDGGLVVAAGTWE